MLLLSPFKPLAFLVLELPLYLRHLIPCLKQQLRIKLEWCWVLITCLVWALKSSLLSLNTPSCFLHHRPAWYDLPPPPYSSDTESLNQADLPPYRSRSGSADSASSQAASSLLSVDDTGHSPGQPDPPEDPTQPRDSMPSQGTEEV